MNDPIYAQLIASGQAPGVIGRADPAQANQARTGQDIPATGLAWTRRRLDTWRDHALDHLDTTLLQPGPHTLDEKVQAGIVLALADVAVRDAFLVRYARADTTGQARAADRLAPIAAAAPDEFRAPVGTVTALLEWTQARPQAVEHLDRATHHGRDPYTLAVLLRKVIGAGIHPRDFAATVLGQLTEAQCRSGRPPATTEIGRSAGQALAERGWAVHIDHTVGIGEVIAWSGTLTRHGQPAAHVADDGTAIAPHMHWPHGSPHRTWWNHDIADLDTLPLLALADLSQINTTAADPLTADHLATAAGADIGLPADLPPVRR